MLNFTLSTVFVLFGFWFTLNKVQVLLLPLRRDHSWQYLGEFYGGRGLNQGGLDVEQET